MNVADALAAEVTEAHGGTVRSIPDDAGVTVRFRSAGLAFTTKGQAETLRDVTGHIGAATQAVRLSGPRPHPWDYRTPGGADLSAHLASLHHPRRLLRWSVADVAAFAAAAIWTYLLIPFVLHHPGFELQALPPRQGLRRLRVRFPTAVATHSPEQVLHVDGHGLIRRHDYTALAFGRWARAAQTLDAYRPFDGLLVATRRRVTPRIAGRSASGPTLVWIEIDDVSWGPAPPGHPQPSASAEGAGSRAEGRPPKRETMGLTGHDAPNRA